MTDIAKLRELLAKATPGPWDAMNTFAEQGVEIWDGGPGDMPIARLAYRYPKVPGRDAHPDAALIVALHNAAPALLDEVEALRLHRESANAQCRELAKEADALRAEREQRAAEVARLTGELEAANQHVKVLREALAALTNGPLYGFGAADVARAALKEKPHD